MVRKLVVHVVNIILDYLEETVHNLFTITTNIQGVVRKKSSETLNKILEKYLRKKFIFSKVTSSKTPC